MLISLTVISAVVLGLGVARMQLLMREWGGCRASKEVVESGGSEQG